MGEAAGIVMHHIHNDETDVELGEKLRVPLHLIGAAYALKKNIPTDGSPAGMLAAALQASGAASQNRCKDELNFVIDQGRITMVSESSGFRIELHPSRAVQQSGNREQINTDLERLIRKLNDSCAPPLPKAAAPATPPLPTKPAPPLNGPKVPKVPTPGPGRQPMKRGTSAVT